MKMIMPDGHTKMIILDIMTLESHQVILRSPWIRKHNPEINWENDTLLLQITLVKSYIIYYQESLPMPIFKTVALLAKETKLLAYKVTLLQAEIYLLYIANKAFSKHCRAKKIYICQEDIFTIENIYNIFSQTELKKQIRYKRRPGRENQEDGNLVV